MLYSSFTHCTVPRFHFKKLLPKVVGLLYPRYLSSNFRLSRLTMEGTTRLGGNNGKEPTYQCRRHQRHRFNPWVGKISWRGNWQPTPVYLPRESYGQRSLAGYKFMRSQRVGHSIVYTHMATELLP